jgi:hypothetical protein
LTRVGFEYTTFAYAHSCGKVQLPGYLVSSIVILSLSLSIRSESNRKYIIDSRNILIIMNMDVSFMVGGNQ